VTTEPARGQVVWVELSGVEGRKPYLVISSDQRNRQLDDVLGARITTTRKPAHLRSVIELTPEDQPLMGNVLCDDIYPIFKRRDPCHVERRHPGHHATRGRRLRNALGLAS
jgi:mRNA interferase MazF